MGLQRAVKFARAEDRVREGEERERGEAEVEGRVRESQRGAVHEGGVDRTARSFPVGGGGRYCGTVGVDEVGAGVDGGYVHGAVGG